MKDFLIVVAAVIVGNELWMAFIPTTYPGYGIRAITGFFRIVSRYSLAFVADFFGIEFRDDDNG